MQPQSAVVQATDLCKTYLVPEREEGLRAAMRSLARRRMRTVQAVDHVSFAIAPGEVVGFLGPNGAGKTTTLKLLAGLLYPTGGQARVLGFDPAKRQAVYLRQIALVMGNRNQLAWDIPALDSFELNRAIYQIPLTDFRRTRDEMIELLGVAGLVHKPIRNLSLGERMKMEIVGALLHCPRVLFLDEPTIGLDVPAQRRLRRFVAEYSQRTGAAVLLTSHYMVDVEELCKRVIVIHHGRLLFDEPLAALIKRFTLDKKISVTLEHGPADLRCYGELVSTQDDRAVLRVPQAEVRRVTAALLAEQPVTDLTVEDAPIDDVVERVFSQEAAG